MENQTITPRYNIDTCSMLVEFNTSAWTARKLDKTTTEEVLEDKQAQARGAARVNKHLLAGRKELDVIQQHVSRVRLFVYANTLPWSDSGIRLLPVARFVEFDTKMKEHEDEFIRLVNDFVTLYPTLITAQAMALGAMFNRDEYPAPETIAKKFDFRVTYMPVPSSGDFRVDIGNEAQAELKSKLEEVYAQRVEGAIVDIKERLVTHLRRMSDRLVVDYVGGEAKPRVFHNTLVDTAKELCEVIPALNIINDPDIESARQLLENTIGGIDADDLRKDLPTRQAVKQEVDSLLDKLSF